MNQDIKWTAKLRTYLHLGIINLTRVFIYRLGLKFRLHPVQYLKSTISSKSFFRASERQGKTPQEIKDWDNSIHFFGWYSIPNLDDPPDWFQNPFSQNQIDNTQKNWWNIPDFGNDDMLIKQLKYQYENGVLYDLPNYHDYRTVYCSQYNSQGDFTPSPSLIKSSIRINRVDAQRLILNSGVSKTIISNHISYGKVTVSEHNNTTLNKDNGYTIYEFMPKKEFSTRELKRAYFFSNCHSSLCRYQPPTK